MQDDDKDATQANDAALKPQHTDQKEATDQTPPEDGQTEETSEPKPKKTAWYTRVISREAAEKREAKREADSLRSQNAMLLQELANKTPNSDGTKSSTVAQAEIDKLANDRATQIATEREFTKACNKIADDGKDEFDDFDESVGTLQQVGGNYQTLLQITTELDDAHRILYHLGKNPEEAERLLSLPPTKMAIAVAKFESKLSKSAEKTISNAPDPITPIRPKSSKAFDPNDPNADRNEWSRWREKNRRKR